MRASVVEVNYPANSRAPDCLVTIPHASQGGDFFTNFPQIHQAFLEQRELLDRFLRLEHDTGTLKLAHVIGQYLLRDHQLSTRVLFPNHIHRGVVDPNRLPGHAIRPLIDYSLFPGLYEALQAEHLDIVTQMRESISAIPDLSRVVAIDLHTMAPWSPSVDPSSTTEAVNLRHDNVPAYIRAFNDKPFRGAKRPIDILTAVPGEHAVGDQGLSQALQAVFRQRGFSISENNPYPLSPVLMSTEIVRQTRGVALDIPKDMVCETAEDGEIDLTHPEVDSAKVHAIGEIIAQAIAMAVRQG